jgi:hypothetical protein
MQSMTDMAMPSATMTSILSQTLSSATPAPTAMAKMGSMSMGGSCKISVRSMLLQDRSIRAGNQIAIY